MTDLRQAAQQALEGWEHCDKWVWPVSALEQSKRNTTESLAALRTALEQQQAEPVSMRMPKVGDKVICLEDESLGEVVSLTGGGSPDINFDDGTRGTYLLREFAELFGYVTPPAAQRPWVGLTDEEITELRLKTFDAVATNYESYRAIEAKLKEKNDH
jgi:hypothetical protein